MSLCLGAAVTQHLQPNAPQVKCSASLENASTKSGGVTEILTARTAATKPTVVCTCSSLLETALPIEMDVYPIMGLKV